MIRFQEFSEIFKGTDFREKELKPFYYSIKKSVILRHLGKGSWPELFKMEESCQWPVLRRIGNPALPIYQGADKTLLHRFIKTIEEEKRLRERKAAAAKVPYWTRLQSIIEERTDLFMQIFGFCRKDVLYCSTVAERYERIREKRRKNRKKIWQIGIGAGTATLAGAAAIWYISKKDKKH